MVHSSRRWLSLLVVALLVMASFGLFSAATPSTALASAQSGSYSYDFFGVQGPAIRGKALWANSDSVDCAGGVAVPGGGVIVATGLDSGARRFMYWIYPPGTDSVISIMVPNASIDNAPPGGWGTTGSPQPVAVCSLFHQVNPTTYRLKSMFASSLGPGNGYALALLDTGINLVVTGP